MGMLKQIAEAHEARGLREASLSSTPASTIGWLATKPPCAVDAPEAVMMFFACAA